MRRILFLMILFLLVPVTSAQKTDPFSALPPVLCASEGRFVLSLIRGADPTRPRTYFLAIYDTGGEGMAADFVEAKQMKLVNGGTTYLLTASALRPVFDPFTGARAVSVTASWKLRADLSSGKAVWSVSYLEDEGEALPNDYLGNFVREGRDFSSSGVAFAEALGCVR
jgi:hypothetical protein